MPQFEQIILRFTGNKMELKNQLKEWCESNDTSMNKKVIDLISDLLEAKDLENK